MRAAAALAGLTAALACLAPPAEAAPPPPVGLEVDGGTAWSADTGFRLSWANPSTGDGPALAATHYLLRDPMGAVAEEGTIAWTRTGLSVEAIPGVRGVYEAEVRLEDAAGAVGAPATALLRFDDARPAPVEPLPLPEWLGRAAFPLRIAFAHPAAPPPLSGIRGYAVAIGSGSGAASLPCPLAGRCSLAETTLPGGIEDDALTLAALPEGTSRLRVVAVSGTGMGSATSGEAVLRVDATDPAVRLDGVPAGWTNRPVRLVATATDAGAGMAPLPTGPAPFTAIRVDEGAPSIEPGARAHAELIGEGSHRIAYYARDAAGNVADGARSNGASNGEPRLARVRIDRTPPVAAFANSQDPRDPELLRVTVADALSGPDPTRGRIGVRRAGSGERFETLAAARPGAGQLRARWDSDAYPRGRYEFRAVAYDAAGNPAAAGRRRDGSPMTLTSPLKATAALRAGFHRGRLRRRAPYGRRLRVAGRLTTGRRTPLAGMPVRIVESFSPGARPATRVSIVRTRPGGSFSHRLRPGPSRKIEAAFAGTPTLTRAASPELALAVRSRVRLRTSSRVARVGGAPVTFGGRLFGGAAAAGRAIHLQFRLPGLPWASFRSLKTDRRGRFRYRYAFSDDDSRGARFWFRAFVPTQKDWPYEPGGSRPVLVRGR